MEDAERFIAEWVLPRTDVEHEYLERLAGGDYRPELVFPDESMAKAAAVNPEALWKVENLRKMPGSSARPAPAGYTHPRPSLRSDLCQDFGHGRLWNHTATGGSFPAGAVLSKKASMASAGMR